MDLPFRKFLKGGGGVGVKKGPRKITFRLGSTHKLLENSYLVLKAKVKKYYKIFIGIVLFKLNSLQ